MKKNLLWVALLSTLVGCGGGGSSGGSSGGGSSSSAGSGGTGPVKPEDPPVPGGSTLISYTVDDGGLISQGTIGTGGSLWHTPAFSRFRMGGPWDNPVTEVSGCGLTMEDVVDSVTAFYFVHLRPTEGCTAVIRYKWQSEHVFVNVSESGYGGTLFVDRLSVVPGESVRIPVKLDEGYTVAVSGCGGTLLNGVYEAPTVTASCNIDAHFGPVADFHEVMASFTDVDGATSTKTYQVAMGDTPEIALGAGYGYDAIVGGSCSGQVANGNLLLEPVVADCSMNVSYQVKDGHTPIVQINADEDVRVRIIPRPDDHNGSVFSRFAAASPDDFSAIGFAASGFGETFVTGFTGCGLDGRLLDAVSTGSLGRDYCVIDVNSSSVPSPIRSRMVVREAVDGQWVDRLSHAAASSSWAVIEYSAPANTTLRVDDSVSCNGTFSFDNFLIVPPQEPGLGECMISFFPN